MASRDQKPSLDDLIESLRLDVNWYTRELAKRQGMLDLLREIKDGITPQQRREVGDLEDLFSRSHRQDRHRKPARPDFGGRP